VIEHFEDLEGVLNGRERCSFPEASWRLDPVRARRIGAEGLRSFLRASPTTTTRFGSRARSQAARALRFFCPSRYLDRPPPGAISLSAKLGSGHSLSRVLRPLNAALSRLFSLGDTFEVYAIKRGTMKDVE
jgi:hypothetical protein